MSRPLPAGRHARVMNTYQKKRRTFLRLIFETQPHQQVPTSSLPLTPTRTVGSASIPHGRTPHVHAQLCHTHPRDKLTRLSLSPVLYGQVWRVRCLTDRRIRMKGREGKERGEKKVTRDLRSNQEEKERLQLMRTSGVRTGRNKRKKRARRNRRREPERGQTKNCGLTGVCTRETGFPREFWISFLSNSRQSTPPKGGGDARESSDSNRKFRWEMSIDSSSRRLVAYRRKTAHRYMDGFTASGVCTPRDMERLAR